MTTQLSLFAPPAASDVEVQTLESRLNETGEWQTAAALAAHFGDDRKVRAIAANSTWIISGQKGYKHLARATVEEVNHFVSWMESQGRQMTRRAEAVRRNAHKIFG